MTMRVPRWVAVAGSVPLLCLGAASPAWAQRARDHGGDGYLFRAPPASFGLRFGFDRPMAGSDLFTFVTDQLTIRRRDFGAFTLGADLTARLSDLSDRVDLTVGVGYAGNRRLSEYRDWVDQDELPIQQTTTFQRVPLSVGLRVYVTPRGRQVGSLAWVPASRAFYVGGGVGAMWYRFRQTGDFVDFQTYDVFRDRFDASGWTLLLHGLAGVEVALGPRFFVTGEGRYTWARATLRDAWVDFDRIDLSGLSFTAGIGFRQ